ncbi:MAG: DUF2807 domain-containing protein [Treponema sp.]
METKIFELRDFTAVSLSGGMYASIVQGDEFKVAVTLDKKLFEYLDIHIHNHTLIITRKKDVHLQISHYEVAVTMPAITRLNIAGSVDTALSGFNDPSASLHMNISGSGQISADIAVKNIRITVGGSGSVDLKGSAEKLHCAIAGCGTVNAFGCNVSKAHTSISGSGLIEINAEKTLVAAITGSGHIAYRGQPALKSSIIGSGFIERA